MADQATYMISNASAAMDITTGPGGSDAATYLVSNQATNTVSIACTAMNTASRMRGSDAAYKQPAHQASNTILVAIATISNTCDSGSNNGTVSLIPHQAADITISSIAGLGSQVFCKRQVANLGLRDYIVATHVSLGSGSNKPKKANGRQFPVSGNAIDGVAIAIEFGSEGLVVINLG